MRAYGDPSVLRYEKVDLAPLQSDEVRLRTLVAPVNHSDLEIRAGNWPVRRDPPFPYVPGLETVGEVVEVGAAVTGVAVGDRVFTMMQGLGGVRAERPGGYAAHVTVAADAVAPVPMDIDPLDLASVGLAGVTAYHGLALLGPLDGRLVVVTGAAGGVGSTAVALAKRAAAKVLGVVARAEQAGYVTGLGADQVVVAQTTEELAAQLPPRTVDAVFETVGGPLFPVVAKALRPGGRLSLIGAVAGGDVRFDAWDLTLGITLTGYTTEHLDGAALRSATAELVEALRSGTLALPARTVLPLDQAAEAHALLERRAVSGRVLLVPGS
jgi:NADPH2:quinone reductase